jgi:hypothetical protein
MTKEIELPDDSVELLSFADFSAAYMTLERTPDGSVYLVSWWFGSPSVVAVVRPNGEALKVGED